MATKVLGIRTVYSPEYNKTHNFEAVFFIDYGYPSTNFISSPEIIEAIQKYGKTYSLTKLHRRKLGRMVAAFNNGKKRLEWINYVPFQNADQKIFSGNGVANELEYQFLRTAKKRFGEILEVQHFKMQPRRRNQLVRRGFPIKKRATSCILSFKEESTRLSRRIDNDRRLVKAKRTRKLRRTVKVRLAERAKRRKKKSDKRTKQRPRRRPKY